MHYEYFKSQMKKVHLTYIGMCLFSMTIQAQNLDTNVEQRLADFFGNYKTAYANIGKCKLERFAVDHDNRKLTIYANAAFGYQPFTEENIQAIYRSIKQSLPGPVNYYTITVYADGQPIENLVPNAFRKKDKDKTRLYGKTEYKGAPWTVNVSKPYSVSQGLKNRHIALWQSHGKYYKNSADEWLWQRPRLFGTTEDLYTQSIVVPYLIPMLENAGATVFTPRERDWQKNEIIVDNDTRTTGSRYLEINYKKKLVWSDTGRNGFAQNYLQYPDNHNPFTDGTARFIPTLNKPEKAFAEWIPNIPEKGRYAVYVTYQTLPESVSDAKYLVFHNGGVTEFRVNQQIGGGTWVYLGTFEFDKGTNEYGMVVLSNESSQNGVVCADAVRFGGGMGNITRGGKTSGMPRYLEGARYWAQWAGMPYNVYSKSQGENDYNDDINTRSLMTNYLSGGSIFNPTEKGLGVPFELVLGVHSDAGFSTDSSLIGTLGIYTTDFNDGKTNCGISRYASRDLADMVLTGIQKDITSRFGIQWARRGMWNRNYSETRLPAVPSIILETLSHQNFADLKLGYEPDFKFTLGRSVYKSILKYNASMHGTAYTVQPLPVSHFAIDEGKKKNTFHLRWTPTEDVLEPTAKPQGYIIYTRIGYGGFDNGIYVKGADYTIKVEPGLIYSFKITAVNKGGESFPSEILSAYKAKHSKGTILIANAFHRTCGPATIETALTQGFDLEADPGLPYINTTAFCGYQKTFNRNKPGIETPDGLGYSGQELEAQEITGNTFDYPFIHGKAIQMVGPYSFVSCSAETIESGSTSLKCYHAVDIIYGAEQKPLSNNTQKALADYCNNGGNLMVSGVYVGSKMVAPDIAHDILRYNMGGSMKQSPASEIKDGHGIIYHIERKANSRTYAVTAPECILPAKDAFSICLYNEGQQSAGIAYKGSLYRTFILGFPFECITSANLRAKMMGDILGFFSK